MSIFHDLADALVPTDPSASTDENELWSASQQMQAAKTSYDAGFTHPPVGSGPHGYWNVPNQYQGGLMSPNTLSGAPVLRDNGLLLNKLREYQRQPCGIELLPESGVLHWSGDCKGYIPVERGTGSADINPLSKAITVAKLRDILSTRAAEFREKAANVNLFDGDRVKFRAVSNEIEKLIKEIQEL